MADKEHQLKASSELILPILSLSLSVPDVKLTDSLVPNIIIRANFITSENKNVPWK
jgi:hypothetical protein